ncbi:MAG TPA: bifunctional 2-methylcitrate dehydratase/aconitate hydratase [Terriglobia bacterium]|nr:bifunctional 2-methylcitrate dehydratase/aconitate hydratase [Terriglobia bacterium]
MSTSNPSPQAILDKIADYVCNFEIKSEEAYRTARLCLLDSLACACEALSDRDCVKLLGPVVPGAAMANGVPVPGADFRLDPVQAAFNIGCLIRWLDFNDTWLALEWGHPSDNFASILAVADYLSRASASQGKPPLLVRDVLTAAIKAYEIQGMLSVENSLNRLGFDHVLFVKVASAAVATALLGGGRGEIINAISQALVDGPCLRIYRHAPNAGSRKSWAAADAASRAVFLALLTRRGEMGYPSVLTAATWGFQDAFCKNQPLKLTQLLSSTVMENILFKIYPAEFHAQTALECALQLHPAVKERIVEIERINLTTHESAIRIIDKTGPLRNPADRDHCLQYIVAIGLIFGNVTAHHYRDQIAADSRIDLLRSKMATVENRRYSADYLDPAKRSVANAVEIIFKDGGRIPMVEVEYPAGHPRRRAEAAPLLEQKFKAGLARRFTTQEQDKILELCCDARRLEETPVHKFLDLFANNIDGLILDSLHRDT